MESRTPAIDRVLEALSPALSAETERIIAETCENFEGELQRRLQDAIGEAKSAGYQTAKAEVERAVANAREEVRQQLTAELQPQLKEAEQNAVEHRSRLDDAFKKAASTWVAERNQLQEQIQEWRNVADAQRQLSEATSQAEILARFIKLSKPFAPGIAVYVAKADGLALWKSCGQASFPEIISQQTTNPESFFKIISVRGKTVAAVCAAQPYRADAVQFLTGMMERAIELFGLRLRASTQAM